MRIGFSYWGFCEPLSASNIAETPDGHRYGRPIFVDELLKRGHDVLALQQRREKINAHGVVFNERQLGLVDYPPTWKKNSKQSYSEYFPDIDVLFCEWRWETYKNKGPNPQEPDLKRQTELLDHYHDLGVPIIVWDTDLRITEEDEKRWPNMVIADPSHQTNQLTRPRVRVPFWSDFKPLFDVDPDFYSYNYTYVGNNYNREEAFSKYYIQTSNALRNRGIQTAVYGNWLNKSPERKDPADIIAQAYNISFGGRFSFKDSMAILNKAICTTHITKPLYNKVAFASPRYLENIVCGTPALVPEEFSGGPILGDYWQVGHPMDVMSKVREISLMGGLKRAEIVEEQKEALLSWGEFNVKHVCDLIESVV